MKNTGWDFWILIFSLTYFLVPSSIIDSILWKENTAEHTKWFSWNVQYLVSDGGWYLWSYFNQFIDQTKLRDLIENFKWVTLNFSCDNPNMKTSTWRKVEVCFCVSDCPAVAVMVWCLLLVCRSVSWCNIVTCGHPPYL